MSDRTFDKAQRIVITITGLIWLIIGAYGVAVHDSLMGLWFAVGGAVLLAARVLMDGDNDD